MMNGLGLDAFNHLRFKRGFCCLAAVLLAGQWFCFGQEAGIAYWGSLEEGPNRVEGVFVELSESSVFLGFDDELELAVFSSGTNWEGSGEFVLSGLASSPDQEGSVPATGRGQARLSSDSEVILETQWEESELLFQAYSSSNVRYYRFELEGKANGEMHLVIGDGDTGYGLLIDDANFLHGGLVSFSEQGTQLFYTRCGDRLEFDLSSGKYVFELADGEVGELLMGYPDSNAFSGSAETLVLSEVWNAFEKKEGDYSDALHFILDGSGSLPVELETRVTLDSRELGIGFRLSAIELELCRLDFQDGWMPLFRSGPLLRVKSSGSGEFDYQLSGFLPASLIRGTYLVQVIGLVGFSADVEIRARFDEMETISAINGSTMYERTATYTSHRFGFELVGQGVRQAIVRAVGPGLEFFNMVESTFDPRLIVSKNGLKRWMNEDWRDGVQPASFVEPLMASAGAFPLFANSLDAVLSLSLGHGQYEASSDRRGDDFGFEIMELYLATETDQ